MPCVWGCDAVAGRGISCTDGCVAYSCHVASAASLVMSFNLQPGTLELQHHDTTTAAMDTMLKPIDHARCRELAHPDMANFAVSM